MIWQRPRATGGVFATGKISDHLPHRVHVKRINDSAYMRVERQCTLTQQELVDWCDEHIKAFYYFSLNAKGITFWFSNPREATHFKLVWVGV